MNKKSSDSALLSHALPVAGWGHALAAMGEWQGTQSLPRVVAALPANACHEVFAATKGDIAAMSGFGVMLAAMLSGDLPCFFVRPFRRNAGGLYPPGLAALGIDPSACFSVHAPDLLSALKATADIARSGAAGAVLVEIEGNPRLLDLTASRRLALAAEKSGTAVLLLRLGARQTVSAAYSRWQVASAPSTPLLAGAPGGPAFDVTLLRHRRMAAGQSARLIWNFQEQRFDEQDVAHSKQDGPQRVNGEAAFGAAFSMASRRAADQDTRRAA
jgi:protein ImuA